MNKYLSNARSIMNTGTLPSGAQNLHQINQWETNEQWKQPKWKKKATTQESHPIKIPSHEGAPSNPKDEEVLATFSASNFSECIPTKN
jgi:hypothetical protein